MSMGRKFGKYPPGQSSPERWRMGSHVPGVFAVAVALIASFSGHGAQAAPPAIAGSSKLSVDLLTELDADPALQSSGQVSAQTSGPKTSSASATPTGTAITTFAKPLTHKVLIQVTKNGGNLSLTTKFYSRVRIHAVNATAQQIVKLLANGNVNHISLDHRITSTAAAPDVNGPSMGADVASYQIAGTPSLTGAGVTVAVIDSGVAPVDDIGSRLIGFRDFVNNAIGAYDDYGHGTHVAGIVAGDGTDSSSGLATRQYKGIAPGANIVGVKVLDAQGNGSASNVIAGLDWCIANKSLYNIKVINLSITGPVTESYKTDPVCQAAEQAVQAGITVIVSAGNNGGGYGLIGSPANDPAVITVGATNSMQTVDRNDDKITTYTSRGPTMVDGGIKPDLVAPGNKVVSLRSPGSFSDTSEAWTNVPSSEYLTPDAAVSTPSAYARMSGTSMSAPAVAGAAALLLQQNPSLTPPAVKLALMFSAQLLQGVDPVLGETVVYDPFTQGAGELNIPGALQLASLMTPSGLSETPTLFTKINDTPFPWFGVSVPLVLGLDDGSPSQAFWATLGVWSSTDIWGANHLSWGGDHLSWGGDHLSWGGDHLSWGGDHLSWGGDQLTFDGDHLSWGGDHLSWGGDHLSWGGDHLSWGGDQLAFDGDHLSWGGDHLSWGGDHLSWGGDHLSWGGDHLSWGGDHLSWGGDHLSWGGDQMHGGGD